MILLAILMILPLVICIVYKEKLINYLAFIIPMVIALIIGFILSRKKTEDTKIVAREGFIIVGFSWILMSLVGCLPYIISRNIPNFFDAFFEIVSGFTTTGSSVVTDYSVLDHSIMFWRSFAHWIGGMGVLVFILAIIPESSEGSSMHILRAESPGPQVGKLVSKMKVTSRILYLIYLFMTIALILILWLGPDKKMTLFNSMVYSFGAAGTGGLSIDATGLAGYAASSQYILAIAMLLFAINFSIYYLLLIGKFREVFKNEELKAYFIILFVSILLIGINIYGKFENTQTVEATFRHSLFQVTSIISTTGYASTDFIAWPGLSIFILMLLTWIGACAGSTAGGLKVSRFVILIKSFFMKIRNAISPRKVEVLKMDGKTMKHEDVCSIENYLLVYTVVFLFCTLLISFDGYDVLTNLSASLTCISNVGPGYTKIVGPYGSFSGYSWFSKMVLSLEMIAGRLEFFPILILFSPNTWKKRI